VRNMTTSHDITGWERFQIVLRGQIPDRVPLIHTWGEHELFMQQVIASRGFSGTEEEKRLQCRREVGLPIGLQVGWWSPLPRGRENVGGVNRYTQGALQVGSSLKLYENLGDLDLLRQECRHAVAASHRFGLGCRGNITNCFHAIATACGLEAFALAMYDEPDWVHEAMEQAERYNRRGLEVMLEEGVDIVLFDGDCAYKTAPMVAPDLLRRFWFDRTKRNVDLVKQAGKWAWYHTDGKVDDILPMLIEMGFDCFHGCEKAANDLGHLKRKFGSRITLIGNVDNYELACWPAERIAAETAQMLRQGAPGGRFAADVNTAMPQDAPLANYRAFHDTVMRLGRYNPDGTLQEL